MQTVEGILNIRFSNDYLTPSLKSPRLFIQLK